METEEVVDGEEQGSSNGAVSPIVEHDKECSHTGESGNGKDYLALEEKAEPQEANDDCTHHGEKIKACDCEGDDTQFVECDSTQAPEVQDSKESQANLEGSTVVRRKLTEAVADLEDDLACSVCLLLAVEPTTLVCGHTSCRLCLARWYFASKKKECPLCRQSYLRLPKTNIQLKNMIYKLYPEKSKEREAELEGDEDAKSLIEKYNKEVQEDRKEKTDMASFCAGIIIAFCTFAVVYLAWYWQSSDTNLLVLKPVETWKSKDVSQWLRELGWADVYCDAAVENNVDGTRLLTITKSDLEPELNMTNERHQSAFLLAVELLQKEGIKMPANLWEYKAVYPGRSLFLVFCMKDFPRTSLLYMWVYFHDDMFRPFLRATTGTANATADADSDELQQGPVQEEDISSSQWMMFLMCVLLVPEWLVIMFAVQMFSHHLFSPIFVIATAVLYQVLEYLALVALFRNLSPRSIYDFVKQYSRQLMSAFMFMVLWPIVPRLVCDIFFYGALYISPVQASMTLYQKFTAHNIV